MKLLGRRTSDLLLSLETLQVAAEKSENEVERYFLFPRN